MCAIELLCNWFCFLAVAVIVLFFSLMDFGSGHV